MLMEMVKNIKKEEAEKSYEMWKKNLKIVEAEDIINYLEKKGAKDVVEEAYEYGFSFYYDGVYIEMVWQQGARRFCGNYYYDDDEKKVKSFPFIAEIVDEFEAIDRIIAVAEKVAEKIPPEKYI